MRTESIQCDACGALKRDVNCWFVAFTGKFGSEGQPGFIVYPWPGERDPSGSIRERFDLCGSACVTKKLSAWLGSQQGQPATVVTDIGNGQH